MKVQGLLSLHQQHHTQNTLADSLGDAYLYRHNPIFRNIRNSLLNLGYHFQCPPTADYQSLPFTQLENILKSQRIPYYDNVSVLKSLPDPTDWKLIQGSLKRNFIFHESCHAVARSHTQKNSVMQPDPIKLAFFRLLEESFANTLELLSIIFVQDVAHRCFYQVNSFTALFEHQKNFQRACTEFGQVEFFHAMMMGYIYSNFLKSNLSEKDLQLISELAFNKTVNKKVLGALLKLAFQLDLDFKHSTTPLYFLLHGPQIDLKQVQIPDLLVSHQPLIKNLIQEALQNSVNQEHT